MSLRVKNNRIHLLYEWLPYLMFIIYDAVLHVYGFMWDSDDLMNIKYFMAPTLKEEIKTITMSYKTWSSRFLINPTARVLLHLDVKVWMVIDILMFFGIFLGVCYLLDCRNRSYMRYVSLLLMLCYPFHLATDTGWVISTVTYIWPTFFLVISTFPVKWYFEKRKLTWRTYIWTSVTVLMAANKEEVSVLLCVLMLGMMVFSLVNKRWTPIFVTEFLFASLSVLYHFFSQGNQVRFNNTESYFRNLSVFDKIDTGLTTTLTHALFKETLIIPMFIVILVIGAFKVNTNSCNRVLSLVPMVMWTVVCGIGAIAVCRFMGADYYDRILQGDMSLSEGKYRYPDICVAIIISFVFWVVVCMVVNSTSRNNKRSWLYVILIISGIFSRVVAGFAGESQSLYERTYLFLDLSLIVIMGLITHEIWVGLSRIGRQRYMTLLACFAVFGFFENMIGCYVF